MKRIAVTGSSGYFGRKLITRLRRLNPQVEILGIDVALPRDSHPDEFIQADIRSEAVIRALEDFEPDTVIHLAFIVNPIHDETLMSEINVGGTLNVMKAVQRLQPERFLVASSATAFGAWPDNPVPLPDSWRMKPRSDFRYAADKTDLEQELSRFAKTQTNVHVSWVRPTVIYGPGVNNYLSRFLMLLPAVLLLDGQDTPLQFVHEDDVVEATCEILQRNARGGFNIGPPNWVMTSEIAREMGKRTLRVPFRLVRLFARVWWKLRLYRVFSRFEYPAGFLYFLRYPWVVAPDRLQTELGYEFRYSSLDTLREMLHRKGQLATRDSDGASELPAPHITRETMQPAAATAHDSPRAYHSAKTANNAG